MMVNMPQLRTAKFRSPNWTIGHRVFTIRDELLFPPVQLQTRIHAELQLSHRSGGHSSLDYRQRICLDRSTFVITYDSIVQSVRNRVH